MNVFAVFAIFISIAAVASYINYRYIKLPTAIGLMFIGLTMSLVMIGLGSIGIDIESWATRFLGSIDFGETLMKGMLSFLLFAGALKININDLADKKWIISLLATGGVVMTTILVGIVSYYTLHMLDISIPFMYCLVFGALISPTDPVAVMALLKSVGAPKSLETKIAGESLFNDGVGVVIFTVLLELAIESGQISFGNVALLFVEEAIGGFAFGLVIGYIAYRLLKNVDDHSVEILLTLGLVCGGYALASVLHVSGPIATVVAGLLIGNYGRRFAMSETTRDHLDKFWELVDETLNAVLFVWIGFEILVLSFKLDYLLAGIVVIPLVLIARFISVSAAIHTLKLFRRRFSDGAIRILTWGGLRGGISIALALSIPSGAERDLIVAITYVVVVFSIIVQGLTIKKVVQKSIAES